MAPNGIVALMVDGPSLENRFGRAEYVFARPNVSAKPTACHITQTSLIFSGEGALALLRSGTLSNHRARLPSTEMLTNSLGCNDSMNKRSGCSCSE
jgi:hypothetical protein